MWNAICKPMHHTKLNIYIYIISTCTVPPDNGAFLEQGHEINKNVHVHKYNIPCDSPQVGMFSDPRATQQS